MERIIVFDVETPNASNHRISSIGISVIEDGRITEEFGTLVNPECGFDAFNIQLTGIRPEMVQDAPTFPELWQRIEPLMNSGILAAHNAVFDLGVLGCCLRDYGIRWKPSANYLCTVQMGRKLLPGMSHKLNVLCEFYQISLDHHRAESDSHACAEILLRFLSGGEDYTGHLKSYFFSSGPSAGPVIQDAPRAAPAAQDSAASGGMDMPDSAVPESAIPAASDLAAQAKETLSRVYGYQAFRPGQQQLAEGLLARKDVLGIMPTGSGKSLCYQIPALLLKGTTLVISPLISLMKDQVTALKLRGIPAAFLNSSMDSTEYADTARQAARGDFRILYVAPERLQAPGFQEMCRRMTIPLIAVDEAHCISQWGQDFRPSYLKIPDFVASLPERPVMGAFTATATPHVRKDILDNLGLRDPVIVSTGFDRPNLSFSVYQPKNRDEVLLNLLRDRFRQCGIVYCATRKNVDSVCTMLAEEGFSAARYHAGLTAEERLRNQEDFLFDRVRIMVATNAFGMGIDKSNISFVIHYNMPKSLEAYYQEAGRAGRDGCDADCILLYSPQDVITARWLIEHSEENPDLSPEERAEVRAKDEERLKWMAFYAKSRKCLRSDILRYFGENSPGFCGNCSNCVPDCEHTDITTEAQMILSCVARTEQQLPEADLTDLLRGLVPEELPETIHPGELTTFGLMKDTEEPRIGEIIRSLLDQGYLDKNLQTEILTLNAQSREVLFRHRRVAMRRNLKNRQTVTGEDLFQALQKLRYEISSEEYIAASTLFSDGTLRDLCAVLPRDRKQLAAVGGMGLYKANKYGDRILAVISAYMPSASPEEGKQKKKQPAEEKQPAETYRDRVIRSGSTEAYQPWTEAEDRQLAEELEAGMPLKRMAEIHRRTRGAILSRLRKLGKV